MLASITSVILCSIFPLTWMVSIISIVTVFMNTMEDLDDRHPFMDRRHPFMDHCHRLMSHRLPFMDHCHLIHIRLTITIILIRMIWMDTVCHRTMQIHQIHYLSSRIWTIQTLSIPVWTILSFQICLIRSMQVKIFRLILKIHSSQIPINSVVIFLQMMDKTTLIMIQRTLP